MPERDMTKIISALAGLGIAAALLIFFIKLVAGAEDKISLKEVMVY